MKYIKVKYRLFLALLLLVVGVYASLYDKYNKIYELEVVKLRSHYDQYIRYYEDSPLEKDILPYFKELDYFKVSKEFRVNAHFTQVLRDTFKIKLTKETEIAFLKFGVAKFSFQNSVYTLLLLKI